MTALATGVGLIALMARTGANAWTLTPAVLVAGAGIGFIFPPMGNLTMSSVEPRLTGTASGIFNTARQVGGVLGSAAVGVLLQARISVSITEEATAAAVALPEQYRVPFAEGIANAAESTSEFGSGGAPALFPGIPAEVGEQAQRLAQAVVHNGLTDAARVTLLLPAAVLLLGVLAALTMRRPAPRTPPAADTTSVDATTPARN